MKNIQMMQRIQTCIGLVLGVVTMIVLLMHPKRLLYYSTVPPAAVTFCSLGVVISVFAGTFGQIAGCRNQYTPSSWEDSKCVLQGTAFVFFGLASTTWWSLIVVNIVLVVYSVQVSRPFVVNLIYHGYAWGTALLLTIIALARKAITATPGGGPCFLDFTISNGWFADGLFYFPIGTITQLTLIALAIVSWRLRNSWTRSGHARLLAYGVCYGLLGEYNLVYRIYTRHEAHRLRKSLEDWFTCAFQAAGGAIIDPSTCTPEFLLNYPMFVVLTFCVLALTLLAFVFFACTVENWHLLRYRLLRSTGTTTLSSGGVHTSQSSNP